MDAWTRFISSEAPLKAPKERWYRYLPRSLPLSPSSLRHSFAINLANRREKNICVARPNERRFKKKRDLSQIPDSTHFAFRVASLFLLPRIMQMEKEETEERERARKELSERGKESVASQ